MAAALSPVRYEYVTALNPRRFTNRSECGARFIWCGFSNVKPDVLLDPAASVFVGMTQNMNSVRGSITLYLWHMFIYVCRYVWSYFLIYYMPSEFYSISVLLWEVCFLAFWPCSDNTDYKGTVYSNLQKSKFLSVPQVEIFGPQCEFHPYEDCSVQDRGLCGALVLMGAQAALNLSFC